MKQVYHLDKRSDNQYRISNPFGHSSVVVTIYDENNNVRLDVNLEVQDSYIRFEIGWYSLSFEWKPSEDYTSLTVVIIEV